MLSVLLGFNRLWLKDMVGISMKRFLMLLGMLFRKFLQKAICLPNLTMLSNIVISINSRSSDQLRREDNNDNLLPKK